MVFVVRVREESRSLAQKFEHTTGELRSVHTHTHSHTHLCSADIMYNYCLSHRGEITRYKRRNDELTLQLNNYKMAKEEVCIASTLPTHTHTHTHTYTFHLPPSLPPSLPPLALQAVVQVHR